LDLIAYEGVYSFIHDGWQGTLTLKADNENQLKAWYDSIRFARRFVGSGSVAAADPRHLKLVIHRFNEAPRQMFDGYLFGGRNQFLAGTTTWRNIPFGFFARKSGPSCLAPFGTANDRLSRRDFLGEYTLWTDGGLGGLEVIPGPRGIRAFYVDDQGTRTKIAIEAGGANDHEIKFELPAAAGSGEAHGYFFTRPKNGAAGLVKTTERTSGFFMTKYRDAVL
jgi:hypothetical protein